eukprot:9308432-Alexandrium_andersonii.AAC.1
MCIRDRRPFGASRQHCSCMPRAAAMRAGLGPYGSVGRYARWAPSAAAGRATRALATCQLWA